MKNLFVLLALISLLSGCAFKSVMEGDADNILKARIYSFDDREWLVMLEAVFQATSKESGRGLTVITGFNDMRISVYSITDGQLLVRKKIGKQTKKPIEFLGCTRGNLWFYSLIDGIHSLDPETLDIKITQDSIFNKNPDLRNNLATCEWYQVPQFFQFNEITSEVVLTDNKGYRYFLDPENLKATKIPWEYRPFDPRRDQPFVSGITFPQPYFNLSGDLRKQIKVERKEINQDVTFLEGQFIAERNPVRLLQGLDNNLTSSMLRLESVYPVIMGLEALNGGQGPRWDDPRRDTFRKLDNIKYMLESEVKNMEQYRVDIAATGWSSSYVKLLSPDTTSFFIFHKSGTEKDAKVMISRVEMKNFQDIREIWNTEIPGLFFDPSDASETNPFKEVFSKGNPEFGFSQFDMAGNRLIVIWMLHVHCLDMETGTILWKFRV